MTGMSIAYSGCVWQQWLGCDIGERVAQHPEVIDKLGPVQVPASVRGPSGNITALSQMGTSVQRPGEESTSPKAGGTKKW